MKTKILGIGATVLTVAQGLALLYVVCAGAANIMYWTTQYWSISVWVPEARMAFALVALAWTVLVLVTVIRSWKEITGGADRDLY